jgi:hypothetical protein
MVDLDGNTLVPHNSDVPITCILSLLSEHKSALKLEFMFKGNNCAMAIDAWTSNAQVEYIPCTIHWQKTWSFTVLLLLYEKMITLWRYYTVNLGIEESISDKQFCILLDSERLYEMMGCSRAQECDQYAEKQIDDYSLPYSTAMVMDEKAIFWSQSAG